MVEETTTTNKKLADERCKQDTKTQASVNKLCDNVRLYTSRQMDHSPFHCVPSTPYLNCTGPNNYHHSPLAVVPELSQHAVPMTMLTSQVETPGRLLVPGTPVVGTSTPDAGSIFQPLLFHVRYGQPVFRLTPDRRVQSPEAGDLAEQIVPATPHQSALSWQSAEPNSLQKIKQTELNSKCVLHPDRAKQGNRSLQAGCARQVEHSLHPEPVRQVDHSLQPDWARQVDHSLQSDRARQGDPSLQPDRARQGDRNLQPSPARQGNHTIHSDHSGQETNRIYVNCHNSSQSVTELSSTLDLFNGADIFM